MSSAKHVAVIGGGLMGSGITQVFASAGYRVSVFEPFDEVRNSFRGRLLENLRLAEGDPEVVECVELFTDLAETLQGVGFVTEAVPEKLELKRSIFAQMVELSDPQTILASNSSVIPITRIAEGLKTAERCVGTHWWNPAHLVPLVEVIQGAQTSLATVEATMSILAEVGKEPAHVKKDVPGFVGNRMQHALWREAIAMVAEGICDAATVDKCVKNSFGLRLPVLGPLENADLVGTDLTLDIHRTIIPELNRDDRPSSYLEELVESGKLGFKSGEGFMKWNTDEQKILRERLAVYLLEAKRKRDSGASR